MDFIVNQPDPAHIIIEQPPVTVKSPLQAEIFDQTQPPVIVQPPNQNIIIDELQPPVIVQPPNQTIIYEPSPASVIITTQVQPPMQSQPVSMKCNFCHRQIITLTRPVNGTLTWLLFGGLFLFCIWPFCLIPLCVNACKDIEHSCPICRNILYVYKRM